MGADGDHPRLQHGLYRRHRRQRGPARLAKSPGSVGNGFAVDRGSLFALSRRLDFGRRVAWRPLRPPTHFRYGRCAFHARLRLVRAGSHHHATDCGTLTSRRRRRAPDAGKPRHHQRVVRGGRTRQGHRHLVGRDFDHVFDRPATGRLAGAARFLAGDFLPERPARRDRPGGDALEGAGEPRREGVHATGLRGRGAGDFGTGRAGLWPDRLAAAWILEVRAFGARFWAAHWRWQAF